MELNEEQIIKALECCYTNKYTCLDCPFQDPDKYMECAGLALSALELIKELTEENEAWQKQLISTEEKAGKAYYELACEVENLRAENENLHASCTELTQSCTKLTEENERLKGQSKFCYKCGKYYISAWKQCPYCLTKPDIANDVRADTVREMQKRLEKHFCHDPAFLGVEQRLIMDVIDQIAKEMEEGL